MKNVIVLSNGMNVYPEDIEGALKADHRVEDAVVLGVQDGSQGVQVHAVLVLGEDVEAQEVVREANRWLAVHQRIGGFTVWPEPDFPRTTTMKPRREEIMSRLAAKPTARAL